ncbi:hypothetical protein Ahy_B08g089848 [Arachis hypogaea]|uniref:Protein FAR1-RELATED SEQUENCE n=1 Tax=Arachis hypogaea TaxID=3818 RepID=A0A444XYY3_ARAHY|nr:hypothetical protein Ahy_B08g089848 [Arachis hypogaea]
MRSTQRSESMHACIFQQVHHTQQLLESICEAIRQLPSKQRAKRERIGCCRFSHRDTMRNKISNRGSISSTIQRKGELHHKIKAFYPSFYNIRSDGAGFLLHIQQVFVTYDTVSREVKCQCLLFELRGILCRHSLSVLSFERSSQDEPLVEQRSKRFDDLVFRSHNNCEFASESEELTGILHRAFDNVMAEMQEYQARSKGKSLLSHEEATLSDVNNLQSPPHVKTRGRSKNRLGSNLKKKISNATKKKKKTFPSELNLLDGGSTIQSSYSLYNALDTNYPREESRNSNFY